MIRMYRELIASLDAEIGHLDLLKRRLASVIIANPELDRVE